MAQRELTLRMADELLERISRDASAAGVSPETYAAHLLEQSLLLTEYDWEEDPQSVSDDGIDEGPFFAFEEVREEFSAELDRRLAEKARPIAAKK